MKAHGEFNVECIGNVVHAYPIGGFNEEGIEHARHLILAAVPPQQPWVLFEHPKNLAGLTPEALTALINSYQMFSTLNCQAIAIEVCPTWQGVIAKELQGKLTIPYCLESNVNQLKKFVKQSLTRA